jgi:2-dehydropantoate 2-reductase
VRFVIVGAGAVGGVVGGRLATAGHDVTLVARGAHLEALQTRGLELHSPAGMETISVRTALRPTIEAATIILLAVKTHDVPQALRDLAVIAPATTPVVCMTNGLEAERLALRWFERVYGMCVTAPTTFVEPGVVEAWGAPVAGMFDVGRYPSGCDDVCAAIASAFETSRLSSRVLDDVLPWKRSKLIVNLSNALDALCGPRGRTHAIADAIYAEGRRCFAAASLTLASDAAIAARRGDFHTGAIAGRVKGGGSTFQSLQRGTAVTECEFLNGEITLLGRMHGVPTPLNDAALREVTRAAAAGVRAGSMSVDELAARLRT